MRTYSLKKHNYFMRLQRNSYKTFYKEASMKLHLYCKYMGFKHIWKHTNEIELMHMN